MSIVGPELETDEEREEEYWETEAERDILSVSTIPLSKPTKVILASADILIRFAGWLPLSPSSSPSSSSISQLMGISAPAPSGSNGSSASSASSASSTSSSSWIES